MPYILDLYVNARRHYIPKLYSGRVIIYNADEDLLHAQTWIPFATGGVEIHQVTGGHFDVLKEPNIKVWGNHLRTYLHKAQSELSGSECTDQRSKGSGQLMADGEVQRAKSEEHRPETTERGQITDLGLGEVS